MKPIPVQEWAAVRAAANASTLEKKMALILRTMAQDWPEMPVFESEYRFSPERRWRFDFCFPGPFRLAIECDGGIWTGGRHTTGSGFEADCEKMNAAAVLGYRVLRFTSRQIDDAQYVERTVRAALERRL